MSSAVRWCVRLMVLVVSATSCGGDAWRRIPTDGPSARGHAAYSCTSDGDLFVWGGVVPTGTAELELAPGGGILTDKGWESLAPSELAPRRLAGSIVIDRSILVWGGAGGLAASGDPNDFTFFDDGAVYRIDEDRWEEVPASPLTARLDPSILRVGSAAFIYGGQARPGGSSPDTLDAAFFDLSTWRWTPAQPPPAASVVASIGADLLSFGATGIARYHADGDTWQPVPNQPRFETDEPQLALPGPDGTLVLIEAPRVWTYSVETNHLIELPPLPIDQVTNGAALDSGLIVWGETEPMLLSHRFDTEEWTEIELPHFLERREGTASCVGTTAIHIWGGWRDRGSVLIASDSGLTIDTNKVLEP